MRTCSADVVVVGGGVIGASVAYQLAVRGAGSVVVCEQHWGAGKTATTQSGGVLRVQHTADCDIELAARSLPTYRDFCRVVGGYCGYVPCGFALLVGEAQVGALRLNVEKARFAGGRIELLEPAQLARRYPGLRLDGVAAVGYEPDGGYGNPASTARELLLAARAAGARVHAGVRVEALLSRGERITGVRTNLGEITASTVVLAGGASSARVAATAGLDLPITGEPIGIALSRSAAKTGYHVPAAIDDTLGNYFRPDGTPGMYFGVSCDAEPAPTWTDHALRGERIETARAALQARVPALADGQLAGTRVGVDGYTPDRHPLIGPAGPDGLYLATGMSGGGYKIAPAVGELAAAQILTGIEQKPLLPYRPQRFIDGEPIAAEFGYQWM